MKKGDKVFCLLSAGSRLNEGEIYTVNNSNIDMVELKETNSFWNKKRFSLAIKNNKLNRKLYPDAVEVSGYLRID